MEKRDESAEQARIDRINKLLDRLDQIPNELDRINGRLYSRVWLDRNDFHKLVNQRTALLIEWERVEKELKETYRIKFTTE